MDLLENESILKWIFSFNTETLIQLKADRLKSASHVEGLEEPEHRAMY